MRPLRAAVIGLGVGEQHVEGYRAAGCEVVALCDMDAARLARVAARHPGVRATTEPSEVLADPAVDVVSVASWDDAHFAQAAEAIRRGKHVFLEKPAVLFRDEAERLRALLRAHDGVRLSSNLVLRASPRFVALRARLRSGRLGRLYYAEADYLYGRLHKLTDGWRGRLPHYSVVLGGGIHMVDLLLWLTGERVVEVSAYGNRIATEGSPFRHLDLVAALLRFESGLVAKVASNFGCVHPHFHALTLFGTEATFVNGPEHATVYESRGPGARPLRIDDVYPGVHKGGLLPSFVDAIRGRGAAAVTEDDTFEALAVCFAIDEAARGGGSAPVRPIGTPGGAT